MVMSLVDAVESKYAMIHECNFPGIRISGSPGKNCSGRLILPYILVMDDCGVKIAGEEEKLKCILKDVLELDLGRNHLSSWDEVLKIFRCVPSIESINLTWNPLGEDPSLPNWSMGDNAEACMSHLRTVVLNSTGISWDQVLALLPKLPQVQELHLGVNDYEEVPSSNLSFPTVTNLYFNGNKLTDFEQLVHLGRLFPSIQQLMLIRNCIERIEPEKETEDIPAVFTALQNLSYLNLSENRLTRWSCIDQLRHAPCLTDLRIMGNPLFEDWPVDQCRIHVIARLPDLVRLNGSAIEANEREDAERAFIRYFMDREEKPQRYHELEELHGRLDPLANVDLTPRSVVNFVIRCGDSSRTYGLNIAQNVGAAKREVCGLLNLNPAGVRMYYVNGVQGPEELKFINRGLHSYKPEDGEELMLVLKPGYE